MYYYINFHTNFKDASTYGVLKLLTKYVAIDK